MLVTAAILCATFSATPDLAALTDACQQQIASYRNLRFELDVKATFFAAPIAILDAQGEIAGSKASDDPPLNVAGKETFEIVQPKQADQLAWRRWERFEAGSGRLLKFYAAGERKSATYQAPPEVGPNADLGTGQLLPFTDNMQFSENVFDRFLSCNLQGIAQYDDQDWSLSPQVPIVWEAPQATRFLDRDAYLLRGVNRNLNVQLETIVLAPPQSLVVKRVFKMVDAEAPLETWEVTKLGQHGDLIYPAAGQMHQAQLEFQRRVDYEFSVVKVEDLQPTDRLRAAWYPAWPLGTAISDRVHQVQFEIPVPENPALPRVKED